MLLRALLLWEVLQFFLCGRKFITMALQNDDITERRHYKTMTYQKATLQNDDLKKKITKRWHYETMTLRNYKMKTKKLKNDYITFTYKIHKNTILTELKSILTEF